jgi:hypothetical protein
MIGGGQSCTMQPKRQPHSMANRNHHGIASLYTQVHDASPMRNSFAVLLSGKLEVT